MSARIYSFPFGQELNPATVEFLAWRQRQDRDDHIIQLVDNYTAAMSPLVEEVLQSNCDSDT